MQIIGQVDVWVGLGYLLVELRPVGYNRGRVVFLSMRKGLLLELTQLACRWFPLDLHLLSSLPVCFDLRHRSRVGLVG